jgi:hypothetical protein
MSSVTSLDASAYLEPKTEDSADYEGLQDIDMDTKPLKEESPASQQEQEATDATSQADEEMEDLFGDEKDVDEVKHEG